MAMMQGPLSKWTNVMKGWQYRWFVLDENAGLMSYYTSKEKMMRGARRGCVRLRGAVIGIDDEDDSTFTITVDQKTFHFQARDVDEKEKWINALEATIVRHAQPAQKWENKPLATVADFDQKLTETDAYLQILIEQVQSLDAQIADCEDEVNREKYNAIKSTAEAMIESIKQSIVLLQITKATVWPQRPSTVYGKDEEQHLLGEKYRHQHSGMVLHFVTQNVVKEASLINGVSTDSLAVERISLELPEDNSTEVQKQLTGLAAGSETQTKSHSTECLQETSLMLESPEGILAAGSHSLNCSISMPNLSSQPHSRGSVQSVSTSSTAPSQGPAGNTLAAPGIEVPVSGNLNAAVAAFPDRSYSSDDDDDFYDAEDNVGVEANGADETDGNEPRTPLTVITPENDYFDELYDDTQEDELDSLDKHGSLITYLLSQVRIGMDLTKIVLPTFILEKRSLLEMFTDFIAHPDLFVGIVDKATPRDRIVQCVRWYLSAFHAGRRSNVAKKPYNPILGETFKCYYDIPGEDMSTERVEDGPIAWATKSNVSCIAEQVSHHPPISAFYGEHYNKRISIDGYIWTKSKFLGLSIGVHMIGQAVISLLDLEEEYMITFPNGYGRSILTVPWMELGGKISVTCAKTGYYSNIEFHTKPFYGGKKDQITAEIFAPSEKKPFCVIKGEWNGSMWAKYDSGQNELFLDTKTMPVVKKQVKPIDQQGEFESRRLWRDVTYHLKNKHMEQATAAKHKLEQRQREEAKQRKEAGTKWETKHFHEVGEHWVYDRPLWKRLEEQKTQSTG